MGKFYSWLGDSLSRHVKSLAWLHATPKEGDKPGATTRAEQIRRLGKLVPQPPKAVLQQIILWLWEVGPVQSGAYGPQPISWSELDSWQRQSGLRLSPWQARLLVRLSKDYLTMLHEAEDPGCPAPWLSPEQSTELKRAATEQRLRRMLSGMADKGQK